MLRLRLPFTGTPGDALRALCDEPHPVCLVGAWAGGGAIVTASPARLVHDTAALDALTTPPPSAAASPTSAGVPAVSPPGAAGAPTGASAAPPFVGGGWFGVLGFGLGESIDTLPPAPPRPEPLPRAQMRWYESVLRQDPSGAWWFEALEDSATARARCDDLAARLAAVAAAPAPRPWSLSPMRLAGAGADGHRAAVAECVERIAAGELFQANVCLRLDGRFTGSPADAFADAAARLAPAYGAYVGLSGGAALLSFSPELFLRRRGRAVETAPIKGTAPRPTDDPRAADAARTALAASGKDAAEHVMIVDLMRNDLGRVAQFGSVQAAPEPDVEPHPGLWHLVTKVRASLREDVTDTELLRATFPPGSVTGAPKVQALKVIGELEGTAREAYTGAIGMVSPHAGLELNVAIRTLELRGDRAWLGAGGGIVADSDPDAELNEALAKARPILAALGTTVPDPAPARTAATTAPREIAPARAGAAAAPRETAPARTGAAAAPRRLALPRLRRPDPRAGLLETIAAHDGRTIDAAEHLARLAASARTLGLRAHLPADLATRVETAAALAGPGRHRLRIVLTPDGAAGLTVHAAHPGPPAPVLLTPALLTGGAGAHKWADRAPLAGAHLICDADGAVLEATSANVWALVDGRLVTPPADGRILPGVTRARALRLGTLDGLPLAEAPLTLDEARRADALLVTSAIRRAAPAALADPAPPDTAPTPQAHALAHAFRTRLGARDEMLRPCG